MKTHRLLFTLDAAPSAAAAPVTAPAPAPSAAPAAPTTEAEFASFAAQSLRTADPSIPAPGAAPESPAAPVAPAAPAVPAAVVPAAPAPSGPPDDLDAPIAPEVLATLGESGQRALQAEREKRKDARKELAALQARLAELEKATPPAPAAPSAPEGVPPVPDPAAAPAAPSAPAAAPEVAALTECRTSADVDALVIRAAREQSLAMELNTILVTAGFDAVLQKFQDSKLETFRGVPLDQLKPEFLAAELAQTYRQADEIKLAAPKQMQVIDQTRNAMLQAVHILPGLKDPNSALRKEFNQMANNPAVRALGPQWPEHVAHVLLGRQSAKPAAAPGTPAPLPATPVPTPAPTPTAPRMSMPAPQPPKAADEVAARLVNGTATENDMASLAAASLRSGK